MLLDWMVYLLQGSVSIPVREIYRPKWSFWLPYTLGNPPFRVLYQIPHHFLDVCIVALRLFLIKLWYICHRILYTKYFYHKVIDHFNHNFTLPEPNYIWNVSGLGICLWDESQFKILGDVRVDCLNMFTFLLYVLVKSCLYGTV